MFNSRINNDKYQKLQMIKTIDSKKLFTTKNTKLFNNNICVDPTAHSQMTAKIEMIRFLFLPDFFLSQWTNTGINHDYH